MLFAAALGGGVLGGLLVASSDRGSPPAVAAPASTPPAPTPTDADRLRASISTVLPSVVTVITDTGSFGSGIVVADGVVMTNYHVVEDATAITVVLATGEERAATPFADDSPFQDVALLRVDGRGLRTARLGTTAGAALGDPVAVISGGVFDFANQVKVGVISALEMDFLRDGVILRRVIQTDAAVNHGDSGGPLIDASGSVIGMVTSVIRTTGQSQPVEGVGLVQSMDLLRPFVESVVASGFNSRPRLGIERLVRHHVPLDDERAAEVGLPISRGAAIIGVQSGSPADEAGIRAGDIVIAVNGIAVDIDLPFVNLIAAVPTGGELRLTVVRGGQVTEVIVRPRPALLGAP